MFSPKTFDDYCRAMQMGVRVEIGGIEGIIIAISRKIDSGSLRCWDVTLVEGKIGDGNSLTLMVYPA
jgi:hypothetical protein